MNRLGHDEVRLDIGAAPEWLYDLVSDVPRTPEWSPEVIACQWLDGAAGPAPGARFATRCSRRSRGRCTSSCGPCSASGTCAPTCTRT
jgi:hypothetical protein